MIPSISLTRFSCAFVSIRNLWPTLWIYKYFSDFVLSDFFLFLSGLLCCLSCKNREDDEYTPDVRQYSIPSAFITYTDSDCSNTEYKNVIYEDPFITSGSEYDDYDNVDLYSDVSTPPPSYENI